jgi:hypothetical protein
MHKPMVYVIQELPGTRMGAPKINIMSASKYGEFKFLLPEFSQIIFSPGPLIFKLRNLLKDYTVKDYLLLTGDPCYHRCCVFYSFGHDGWKIQSIKMGQAR